MANHKGMFVHQDLSTGETNWLRIQEVNVLFADGNETSLDGREVSQVVVKTGKGSHRYDRKLEVFLAELETRSAIPSWLVGLSIGVVLGMTAFFFRTLVFG